MINLAARKISFKTFVLMGLLIMLAVMSMTCSGPLPVHASGDVAYFFTPQARERWVRYYTGAPTGTCNESWLAINRTTGYPYTCVAGVWTIQAFTGGTVTSAITAPSFTANGTGGLGFFEGVNQSSAPSTPTGGARLYFDSSNRLAWTGTNGFPITFNGTSNTASRVYTLPDADSKLPIFSQFITFAGPTAARTVTFPDASFTVARIDAAQTFTGLQTFGSIDVPLIVPTGNVVEQRSSTTAQAFRVYNTYTDASNYERFAATWAANTVTVGTSGQGTGSAQPMKLTGGGRIFGLGVTSGTNWGLDSSGNLIAGTDNSVDLGASGANRPRTGYFGTSVITPSLTLNGGTALATYTETSCTISLKFGGASTGITYTAQVCKYTQIGDMIFLDAYMLLSSKGSSTGTATLTGLPVNATNAGSRFQKQDITIYGATYTGTVFGQIDPSTPTVVNLFTNNLGTAAVMADTQFSNTSTVNINLIYKTN